MNKATYATPAVRELGDFKSATNGVWFGSWRDIFGARAFIAIG